MSGTQPSRPSNIIAREFRGVRLYLKSVHAGRGMRWFADKTKAAKFLMPEALTICDRASREWGIQCAVLDTAGNLAQRPPLGDLVAIATAKLRARYKEQVLKFPLLADDVSEDLYVNRNLKAAVLNLKRKVQS